MGLAEKRQQKEFEVNVLPMLVSNLKTTVGKDVPVEIEWEPFWDGYGHCIEGMASYAPEAILMAMKNICADDMGKEALQGALNKVQLVHNPSAVTKIAFEGGVLLIKHFWGSGSIQSHWIETEIMKKL